MKIVMPRWSTLLRRLRTVGARHLSPFPIGRLSLLCMAASVIVPFAQAQGGGLNHIRQRGQLIVGVDYVGPSYSAGAKYRTPESLDSDAAEALAKSLSVTLAARAVTPQNRLPLLTSGKVDALLVRASDAEIVRFSREAKVVATGYAAQPKLIMRTDTDIKQRSQLKARSICISQGSPYLGSMLARYGARERVVRAPADALLALRTGQCDATVHDDILLNGMLALPEWKKFSASLPLSGPTTKLIWVIRPADGDVGYAITNLMREWSKDGFWSSTRKKWVNDVAFEVYLDQNVPDCH